MRSISAAEDIAEKLNVTVNKVSGGNLQSDYARAEIELF